MPNRLVMTVNEEQIAFYMAIGYAVTQWANVEHALYQLAASAFSDTGRGALMLGFLSIENFRSKLAFADRAFGASEAAKKLGTEWAELRSELSSLAKKRNQVAHGRVVVYLDAPAGRRLAIVPLFGKPSKLKSAKKLAPSGSLCVRDIDLIRRQFGTVSTKLWSLSSRAYGDEDIFAESAQREPQPPSLAELVRQIDAMHPGRGRSSLA